MFAFGVFEHGLGQWARARLQAELALAGGVALALSGDGSGDADTGGGDLLFGTHACLWTESSTWSGVRMGMVGS